MIVTIWECPKCQMKNVDYKELTARPLCYACQVDFDWQDVKVIQEYEEPEIVQERREMKNDSDWLSEEIRYEK